jgi:hypothetical protein
MNLTPNGSSFTAPGIRRLCHGEQEEQDEEEALKRTWELKINK